MIMYLLDKQQNIIKALDNTIVEASMIEEINAANKLTFSVMTNSRIDISIHYVCIPAPKGEEFLLFKLISETVKNDRVEYTAVESAYDELKSYAYIKDVRPQDKTAGEMLTQILQGTRWSLGHIADTVRASTNFYYITVLEAIQKIVELFNVEMTFTVNIDKKTNVISSRRINLYTQQGRRLGKRFEYGSNLLEVTREQSSEDLITALVGRGKGEEVSQGEDGSPDGYGRRITFADIEWKKANGNPTDKPKGQEYVEDKDATTLYGFSDGKPRIGLTTFEDITDPQELLKATWASLQVAKRPKVSFKASVLNVGDLGLGDTVAIIRHDLGIEYFTRVYKVDHDLLDKNNNTIELGDDFSQKSLTNYVSDVAKITENAKNTAEYAVSSANGKNKNYYSKSKPQYANEGDNLFLDLGNGETEYYVWHDGNWELVLSTADTTRVQKQVEEVQRDIADARVEADRLSQEQSKTAKELSDKITDISDKAIKNASDIKSVTDDIANVHADYVSQQANLNQQKQDLDQARQDVLSNSNRIDKLSVGLDSVNINVNNVNSKIDNIKVGGTNLITGTSSDWKTNDKATAMTGGLTEGNGLHTLNWVMTESTTFTYRAKLWTEFHEVTVKLQYKPKGSNRTVDKYGQPFSNVNSGERYSSVTVSLDKGDTLVYVSQSFTNNHTDISTYHYKEEKLEKGNIPTDWSPAPEDEIERVSQLKVDLNGMNATVATNKGDIAQIKLTENGMQQSIKDAQGNISALQNDSKQFKQQFQDVNGSIATITNTANSLSSQLSTKVGTSEYNSFKNQTAQELRTKLTASDLSGYAKSADVKVSVDGLNARFDNLNVGGTNLLKNTKFSNSDNWRYGGTAHISVQNTNKPSVVPSDNQTMDIMSTTENAQNALMQTPKVKAGEIYTVSFWAKADNETYLQVESNQPTRFNQKISTSWVKYSGQVMFQTDNRALYIYPTTANVWVHINSLKLEKGTIATDWSPAPEDMTDKIEVLSGKVTANSNEFSTVYTKITNAKNDTINAIKGDSQWQSMGKIVTNASFLQNADGFAQEVSKRITNDTGQTNLYYNSEFTYSGNDNHNVDGIISTGNIAYSENGRYANYRGSNSIHEYTTGGLSDYKYIEHKKDKYVKVTHGEVVSASVTVWTTGDSSVPRNGYAICTISFYKDLNSSRLSYREVSAAAKDMAYPNYKTLKVENVTVPDGANYVALHLIVRGAADWHFSQPMLVKDDHVGVYVPSTQLQLNQVIDTADSHTRTITDYLTGNNSRFTQLSNNVNLKVNKGDVIGQINLEAGRTLLQNKKIYLDADAVGFSGKAFIPSAAIKDLDAGKITTGTLDAANVNVINLNANNITSGSIKGTNLDINLNSGNVSFQKGRIHDSNNYVDINIDQRYISTSNLFTRVILKNGKMQLMDQKLFDITDDYYFEISNEGKGGTQWLTGATLLGKNSVFLGTKNGAANGSVTEASPMGQTKSSGVSVDDYQPTLITGSSRGVMIKGGETFRLATGDTTPYISVGTGQGGISKNRIIIDADYVHIPSVRLKTTSSSPNVYVADDGALVRSTSAAKYKTDIVRSHDLDYGNKILNVPIATWIDKAEAERYVKKESEQEPVRHFGMIADDLASAGLEMLVTRNNDGELEGIQYDRIAPALIPVIADLKRRLEILERKQQTNE